MLGTLDLHCELLSGIRTRDNQHNAMRPRQKKGAPPVAKMDIMDMAERRALFPLQAGIYGTVPHMVRYPEDSESPAVLR